MAAIGGGVEGLVAQARRAAQRRGQRLSTGHVLLVMLQGGGELSGLLAAGGVREGDLLSALKVVEPEPSSALEVAIERAHKIAAAIGEDGPHPAHVLLAIIRDGRTVAHRCLEQIGASAAAVREHVMTVLGARQASLVAPSGPDPAAPRAPRKRSRSPRTKSARTPVPPRGRARPLRVSPPTVEALADAQPAASHDPLPAPTPPPAPAPKNVRREPRARRPPAKAAPGDLGVGAASPDPLELDPERTPLLCALGRNLTALAARGGIDPVVGREAEVEQLLDVLARRRSNNPLLVGPPGVGKTAIALGLAARLARGGDGVRGLEGRLLIELSASALVSGTGVRGALAQRLRQLRDEVQGEEGRVLLFIDEIHALVGGGEGPDDVANALKTSLARGELPCVGATTEAELRRCFERDAALARRFSPIHVEEPSAPDALAILRGVSPRYELHHAVAYMPDALEAAVELSVRWLPERHLPDKAIGVADLAAARVRRRGGGVVDRMAVAEVVAEQARVPVERLMMRDGERLLDLERLIGERVVGHPEALSRIADALRKGAAGFRGRRPLGTFLLLGPTGVGKTETAKAVSDVLFPSGGMTRFDMSELGEAHSVARLFGAPPGYVGHDEGGQLTEAVRRRPYQLLLLDEIEKAHPEVLLALLPLLDEGRLTDGRGRTVDFTNTVIFMTSNLGAAPDNRSARIGFGAAGDDTAARRSGAERAIAAARRALPPELWNRIDEPLYFGPLSQEEVREIAQRMLASVGALLAREQGIGLTVDPSAIDALVAAGGWDAALGARPMRRTIGRLVEARLATEVLSGRLSSGDTVVLRGDGDRVRFDLSDDGAEAAE